MIPRLIAILICGASAIQAAAVDPVLPTLFFKNLHTGKHQTVVTYVTSLSEQGPWVPMLSSWFEVHYKGMVTVANGAVSGMNSSSVLENVQKQVVAKRPDLVFVEYGINDAVLRFDITPTQARANLKGIITGIRAGNPQVEIILMTMNATIDAPNKKSRTNRPQLADYYVDYTACASDRNLSLMDNYPDWRALAERDSAKFLTYAPDGLHPNAVGIKAITWPNIEKFLLASDKAVERK